MSHERAYYNEHEPYAAAWLRNLIAAGHIADGDVDERSIVDVRPCELRGYSEWHLFAGIGIWSHSLRLAGWPAGRPVLTCSCPCQPFSAAGKGAGFDDQRHLWPAAFHIIRELGAPIVFGEQVEAAIRHGWIDLVRADLEAEGHAFGYTVFGSHSVGAPHIRQRIYWLAAAECRTAERQRFDLGTAPREIEGEAWERQRLRPDARTGGDINALADMHEHGCGSEAERELHAEPCRIAGRLANADCQRSEDAVHDRGNAFASSIGRPSGDPRRTGESLWSDAEWVYCRDGKYRPVEPGTFPLAHGAPARVGRLRAYGNAINAEAAAAFIRAYLECGMTAPNRKEGEG